MKYIKQHIIGALDLDDKFVHTGNLKKLSFLSKFNYEVLNELLLPFPVVALHKYNEKLVLTDLNERHLSVDFKTMKISEHIGSGYPIFENDNAIILRNPRDKEFIVKMHNKLVNTYPLTPKTNRKYYKNLLIEYTKNQRSGCYINCLNFLSGREEWRIDFTWEIGSLQIHKKIILFVYRSYDKVKTNKGYEGERNWLNPNTFLIALDIETGKELWRREHGYYIIDRDHDVVITGRNNDIKKGYVKSFSAFEIDIQTGETLSDVEVTPVLEDGFDLACVDEHGFFYRTRKGPFGKICKTTGKILWEYDLIDDQGDKRSIVDMTQLGNGSLLLRAVPNHPNGELSCIFDPEENMEYSRVKNGERLPES